MPNFNRKKSILVCLKFKIWLYYMKELWFFELDLKFQFCEFKPLQKMKF